jgi:hypothetical protein
VAGEQLSQDDIENEFLRKQLKEPRIHFVIICASSSCPPLPRFAYTEDNVQAKLEDETRKYINSERGTQINTAKNTLYLSKLFDWYAGDFEYKSGSVLDFIKPYLDESALAFVEKKPKIKFIHYDLGAECPGTAEMTGKENLTTERHGKNTEKTNIKYADNFFSFRVTP